MHIIILINRRILQGYSIIIVVYKYNKLIEINKTRDSR